MDDLEFRKKAIIDPDSQVSEFLQKAVQTAANRRLLKEQRQFNHSLLNTLQVKVPDNLSERIILGQQLSLFKIQQKKTRQQQWRNWLGGSLAASIIMTISLSLFLLPGENGEALAQEVVTHVIEDTHALDVHMNVPKSSIDTMLASYGGKLNGPIGQVYFLGHCIIGAHTGIHMVLNTPQGLVTVFLLPNRSIETSVSLHNEQLKGVLYPSQKGSIAIVADKLEAIEPTRQQINQNLNWII
ncbi:DUF3379 family protein [sulfur-oxidizing endosymbiont of Gigantopelta aegis]|uniref:DUF3379 family protein n=1 Tax=sulfur-oxidizing endosymbiont of Gigantopelta aegis TaxID=2794934 RepID=UPI0018DBBE3B|nr:DUF3379 family protein [sulfur-oxidizing endosymbiont of Gigantopelta aegis]